MFSAYELRKIARDKLRGHWGRAILASFLASLLGGTQDASSSISSLWSNSSNIISSSSYSPHAYSSVFDGLGEEIVQFFSEPVMFSIAGFVVVFLLLFSLVSSAVGACVELGHNQFYIDLCNNRLDDVGVLFCRFNIFFKALGLRLFMNLFIFLWSLLFFIPGIIAEYRYSMAPYLMAQDPTKGIRQCVDESKALMDGHKGRLFLLRLSFIGWVLLIIAISILIAISGMILLLIPLAIAFALWLAPYQCAAETAFYLERTGQGIPVGPQGAV